LPWKLPEDEIPKASILMTTFAAIDFETANYSPDSACAVGLVVVQGHRIVRRKHYLIRPPDRQFVFTYLHGIAWEDVSDAPTFAELWPTLREAIGDADFLAAHNAAFDRRVLESCCRTYDLRRVSQPFVCTVNVARTVWRLFPTRLPDVCRHLNIPLDHHRADSDAEACARIVIAARKAGWQRGDRGGRRTL
jgi:DNA polymerase III subunit epsilon